MTPEWRGYAKGFKSTVRRPLFLLETLAQGGQDLNQW